MLLAHRVGGCISFDRILIIQNTYAIQIPHILTDDIKTGWSTKITCFTFRSSIIDNCYKYCYWWRNIGSLFWTRKKLETKCGKPNNITSYYQKKSLAERCFLIAYSSHVITNPYKFRFLFANVLQVCTTEK